MRSPLALTVVALICLPAVARAGGTEFPAGGARAMGRGATGFTRADDPTIMLRNPALLADMWDDMATGGANVLLVDSCFRATGAYGANAGGLADVSDFGDGPLYLQAPPGSTDVNGRALEIYRDEPYPEVCYSGPTPVLPNVSLSMKLAPDLGVGLGFFPPDTAALPNWGDRDGTVQTSKGRRPSPTRYFRSHLNTSFFSALGAVGYRLNDWVRIGAGFQWNLVAFGATTWARPNRDISPRDDVKTNVFGRDLFIPGVIASVHVVPIDAIDLALGFKWSDRVKAPSKLDLTTGAFGTGKPFTYVNAMNQMTTVAGTVPTTTHNQPGFVDSPPIWAPQLSFGVRYADRLVPRTRTGNWNESHWAAGRDVQDSMTTERWDVELDVIVYLNSTYDKQTVTSDPRNVARLVLVDVKEDGSMGQVPARVGECTKWDANMDCIGEWEVPVEYQGEEQISLRLGGDYNVVPDLLAVRAGLSYETDGQDVQYMNVTNYMLGRTGLHAGATLRIADKTDVNIAFAFFIQPDVRLKTCDPANECGTRNSVPRRLYLAPDGQVDPVRAKKYNYFDHEDADGLAKTEVPYGDDVGPNFANAGSYFYDLSVLSFSLTQHF